MTSSVPPASTAEVAAALKKAMRRMPSPVALVSASDPATGENSGLAVTAFLPVCMAPPSMLVCVNRSASAYPLLQSIDRYCINILAASQDDPLATFADPARRSDRFVGDHWQRRHGTLYLTGSPASIFCKKETVIDFGTHSIMIGRVFDVALEENGCPALWHDGAMIPLDQSKLAQS